jgi:hypothetical protein
LECEKLRAELHELKAPKGWTQWLGRHATTFSTLLAVIGFCAGIYQYWSQQTANREAEKSNRDLEFMKPLWEKQLALYLQASEAAATIATSTDPVKVTEATNKFWMLYQGPLIVMEDTSVRDAMRHYGDALKASPQGDLKDLSKQLGSALQKSLVDTAQLKIEQFRQGKFDYTR